MSQTLKQIVISGPKYSYLVDHTAFQNTDKITRRPFLLLELMPRLDFVFLIVEKQILRCINRFYHYRYEEVKVPYDQKTHIAIVALELIKFATALDIFNLIVWIVGIHSSYVQSK